jgi:hypothetical protein
MSEPSSTSKGRARAGRVAGGPAVALLALGLAGVVAPYGWLAGCWEQRAGGRLVEEQWMAPRGGTMLGMSRTTRGDTLVEYEQVRIFERGGKLVYAAHPSGQEPAEFESTTLTDSLIVFENPTHDFPQRIVYQRLGLDSLIARVEGTTRGRARSFQFSYAHVACPPGGPSPAR